MKEFDLKSSEEQVTYGMKGTDTAADALFGDRQVDSQLFDQTFIGASSSSLKLEALKKEGVRVFSKGEQEYQLVLPANITATAVHKLVSSLNPGIEVSYTDEMEEQAEILAKKTKKPIWGFSTEGNVVTLKRSF